MGARRRRASRRLLARKPKKPKLNLKYIYAPLAVLAVVLVMLFYGSTRWGTDGSLRAVHVFNNGDIALHVFDKERGSLARVMIPGETEIVAARSLGTWRVSSVWQLGETEEYGGGLLMDSIMKSFGVPVEYFIGPGNDEFSTSLGIASRILSMENTNLTFFDRLGLFFFEMRVKSSSRVDVDLTDTSYLTSVELADGEVGFRPRGTMPPQISSLFSYNSFFEEAPKIEVQSNISGGQVSQVSNLISTMGGKVLSVSDTTDTGDCMLVGGEGSKSAQVIAKALSCTREEGDSGSFDFRIILGEGFSQRF